MCLPLTELFAVVAFHVNTYTFIQETLQNYKKRNEKYKSNNNESIRLNNKVVIQRDSVNYEPARGV